MEQLRPLGKFLKNQKVMLSVSRINALKWTFPRDASTLGYLVALPLLTHPTHNMLFLFLEWMGQIYS